jgi:diguanylate cyclase (GGDEF)-like protein
MPSPDYTTAIVFGRTLAHALSGAAIAAAWLLFFDIDEFKHVNDTFGHRTGDALLMRVAGEVSAQVRRDEVFARLGGDEFAILAPESQTPRRKRSRSASCVPSRASPSASKVRTCVSPAAWEWPSIRSRLRPPDLVAHADAAMYQAGKRARTPGACIAKTHRPRQMLARLSWNERIEDALENGLLRLHQGVFGCGNGGAPSRSWCAWSIARSRRE